jgi:hypothetical protein
MVSFSFRISRLGEDRKDLRGRCLRGPGKRLKIWEKRQFEESRQPGAFSVPALSFKSRVEAPGRRLTS